MVVARNSTNGGLRRVAAPEPIPTYKRRETCTRSDFVELTTSVESYGHAVGNAWTVDGDALRA